MAEWRERRSKILPFPAKFEIAGTKDPKGPTQFPPYF
jgi:hypothetical protein